MKDQFEIAGRLSNIRSDGYIDRASADLKSYFLQGTFVGKTSLVKALVFGGKEITYQAWYGLEDENLLRDNRTFNVAGMYFDANGNMQFYDNEVDNYQQDHFQLHWNEKWNEKWTTNLAFLRTLGKGFFEQYREDESFEDYGYVPINVNGETIETTDLIRRRWLDNDFFGTTFSATYKNENFDLILGGAANRYIGDHFGEVIWAQYAQGNIRDRYYEDQSTKDDVNFFGKINYNLTKKLSLFGDLQFRYVNYTANGAETGLVDDTFRFFNPKAGLTYLLDSNQNLYFSFGRANREPNRNDYESGNPIPERLDDFELGYRYAKKDLKLNANLYYMRYKNQLVLTGALNDVGAPLRANSGKSYRLGLELDGSINIDDIVTIQQNVTISDNRNLDFVFERDGVLTNLGNTNIAFSPNLIAANQINVKLWENISTGFLSKYVGEQYMGNIDSERSKLDAYFINDYLISYQYDNVGMFESIQLNLLVNNIFDVKYISNGYFYTYDDDFSNPGTVTTIEGAGFYPQATRNFLIGCTLKF
jgi:iron complex outermembrane receptor protein